MMAVQRATRLVWAWISFISALACSSSIAFGQAQDRPSAFALVDNFGAHGDGFSDDQPAILAAARAIGDRGGIIQLSCSKQYYIKSSINLALMADVTLRGCLAAPDDPMSFAGYTGRLQTLGGILRDPKATIMLGRGSGVEHLVIRQQGLALPAKSPGGFAGTALATSPGGTGQAAIIRDVLIIGADICFDDSNGGSRLHIDGLFCDGTSGEIFGPSLDTSTITNVHNWPFATFDVATGAPAFQRSGVGIELKTRSDDTVLGEVFDLGHKVGLLFNTAGSGTAHVDHFWGDNNPEACIRVAGGRGISIASATTYTCGISIDVAAGAEVQITQAFLVSAEHACVNVGGTLSFALLHIEQCHGGGIRVTTPQSVLSVGFLQVLNLAGPWTISVPPGFTTDHVGIAKFFTDAPGGSSLYAGQGPVDPILQAAPTLDLPPSGDAVRLDGRGVVERLRGGWGGRTLTITTAGRTAAIGPGGNVALTNGVSFGGRSGAVLMLRYDATSGLWREVSRSAP